MVLGIIFLFIGCSLSIAITAIRETGIIELWAQKNSYTIINKRRGWLPLWPKAWSTDYGQTVYRITIEDRNGILRAGWIYCGSSWASLLSEQVKEKWDD